MTGAEIRLRAWVRYFKWRGGIEVTTMPDFLNDERWCPNCNADTPHDHERDSSGDRWECQVCGVSFRRVILAEEQSFYREKAMTAEEILGLNQEPP